jgi:hypothetical protein
MSPVRLLATVLVILCLTLFAQPQDASSRIKSEIDRLEQSLKQKPFSNPDLAPINGLAGDSLKAAKDALNAGHLYLSLEKLDQASNLIQGARVTEDKAEAVKSGLPAFESEWGKASLQLTALDREARKRSWNDVPLAIRALAEMAQGESIPLLDGSRGFASSTQPKDGLFYMGQAFGEAEFAKFCASLQLARKPESFPLRSFLPELQKLQEKTNAAFQPPRSIEQHSRFIALNSAIKLAEELDASQFYAGSLYQYLEAMRHYGMLDAATLDAPKQAALKDAVTAAARKLEASKGDDSIAQLFLERASSHVTHADGSAPTADEWRSAQVILDQVLPAYWAAEKPSSLQQRAAGKTVQLTLVRWPYT